jgi:hypothetical protein
MVRTPRASRLLSSLGPLILPGCSVDADPSSLMAAPTARTTCSSRLRFPTPVPSVDAAARGARHPSRPRLLGQFGPLATPGSTAPAPFPPPARSVASAPRFGRLQLHFRGPLLRCGCSIAMNGPLLVDGVTPSAAPWFRTTHPSQAAPVARTTRHSRLLPHGGPLTFAGCSSLDPDHSSSPAAPYARTPHTSRLHRYVGSLPQFGCSSPTDPSANSAALLPRSHRPPWLLALGPLPHSG